MKTKTQFFDTQRGAKVKIEQGNWNLYLDGSNIPYNQIEINNLKTLKKQLAFYEFKSPHFKNCSEAQLKRLEDDQKLFAPDAVMARYSLRKILDNYPTYLRIAKEQISECMKGKTK